MKLSELAKSINSLNGPTQTHSFLLYGPPKTGKTELVATIANAPEIEVVYWFDIENGAATLLRMNRDGKLSDEALDKIIYIKIPDTREDPNAISTILKTVASKAPTFICEAHGKAGCATCKAEGKPVIQWDKRKLNKRTAIVIDSLSQLGASALNLAMKDKPIEVKPGYDEYGLMGKWLGDILGHVQAADNVQYFCISHVTLIEEENAVGTKTEKYYPTCGTKNFSMNTAKYFGTVIYTERTKTGKFIAKSNGGAAGTSNYMIGSRLGLELEKAKELNLPDVLRDSGILLAALDAGTTPASTPAEKDEPVPAQTTKPTGRFGK